MTPARAPRSGAAALPVPSLTGPGHSRRPLALPRPPCHTQHHPRREPRAPPAPDRASRRFPARPGLTTDAAMGRRGGRAPEVHGSAASGRASLAQSAPPRCTRSRPAANALRLRAGLSLHHRSQQPSQSLGLQRLAEWLLL